MSSMASSTPRSRHSISKTHGEAPHPAKKPARDAITGFILPRRNSARDSGNLSESACWRVPPAGG
ncbi:MAG: hypothetical protein HXY18_16000 [Bryobacteraceae bacterium]|nr:hypothetical protein [Bryobacteraceae bacterium]